MTPYHAMTVALMGAVFALTVGSFFIYHLYLTLCVPSPTDVLGSVDLIWDT